MVIDGLGEVEYITRSLATDDVNVSARVVVKGVPKAVAALNGLTVTSFLVEVETFGSAWGGRCKRVLHLRARRPGSASDVHTRTMIDGREAPLAKLRLRSLGLANREWLEPLLAQLTENQVNGLISAAYTRWRVLTMHIHVRNRVRWHLDHLDRTDVPAAHVAKHGRARVEAALEQLRTAVSTGEAGDLDGLDVEAVPNKLVAMVIAALWTAHRPLAERLYSLNGHCLTAAADART